MTSNPWYTFSNVDWICIQFYLRTRYIQIFGLTRYIWFQFITKHSTISSFSLFFLDTVADHSLSCMQQGQNCRFYIKMAFRMQWRRICHITRNVFCFGLRYWQVFPTAMFDLKTKENVIMVQLKKRNSQSFSYNLDSVQCTYVKISITTSERKSSFARSKIWWILDIL